MKHDLTGRIFGRLTPTSLLPSNGVAAKWVCMCSCGKTSEVRASALLNGNTTSCGCAVASLLRIARTTHGQSKKNKTGTYASWTAMKWRCRTLTMPTFRNYRMRGITYCPHWERFENFFADMGERPKGRSLDRIDNSQGYFPENCRWATAEQQSQNRRNVKAKKNG